MMDIGQAVAIPTKQTAKEIMAAKKAAKMKKEIERKGKKTIGALYGNDRNKLAELHQKQRDYTKHMKTGEPLEYEKRLNNFIRNMLHLDTLAYELNAVSLAVFEKLIRGMKVVSRIYDDHNLASIVNMANQALDDIRQPTTDWNGYSPNQRRILLRPLLELCYRDRDYGEIVPAKTVDEIAGYCSSVQIALYTTELYSREIGLLAALFAIISGTESFKSLAKQVDIKESQFREDILDAAWMLYRIIECFENVQPPESITDLKKPVWKKYSNHAELNARIRWVMDNKLIPFESKTGASLINYPRFRNTVVNIDKSFLLA